MATPRELASATPIPAPDLYVWTCAGMPVRIHLALGVIELLGRKIRSGFESAPSRAAEVGGLLMGTANLQAHTITIQDFKPLTCEDRPDHRFVVSEAERSRLKLALVERGRARNSEPHVVGYYRSHVGERLELSDEDLALAYGCFRDPASVFLLINRSKGGSLRAGFFLWDNNRFDSESIFPEFPFEAHQLVGEATEQPTAQIVEEGPIQKLQLKLQLWWSKFHPRLSGRHAGLLFAAVMVCILAYLAWVVWGPADSKGPALALKVERLEKELRVSWDRNAPTIENAREAVLSIGDGDGPPRKLHLDADQLRNGSLVYSPTNSRVRFRLEVTDADETKRSEIVVAVTGPKARAARAANASPKTAMSKPAESRVSNGVSLTSSSEAPARAATSDSMPRPSPMAGGRPETVRSARNRQVAVPPRENDSANQTNAAPFSGADRQGPAAVSAEAAYIAARPVRQLWPNLRPDIRRTITADAEVQVRVLIDQSGQVVRANTAALSGQVSESLASATLDAARLWTFVPAMRGSQPVMSQMVLTFHYRPERGR